MDIKINNHVLIGHGYIPDTNEYCVLVVKNDEGLATGEYSNVYQAGYSVDDNKVICKLIISNIDSWYVLLEQVLALGNDFLELPKYHK